MLVWAAMSTKNPTDQPDPHWQCTKGTAGKNQPSLVIYIRQGKVKHPQQIVLFNHSTGRLPTGMLCITAEHPALSIKNRVSELNYVCTPGQAGPKGDENYNIAGFDFAVLKALIESNGNRSG